MADKADIRSGFNVSSYLRLCLSLSVSVSLSCYGSGSGPKMGHRPMFNRSPYGHSSDIPQPRSLDEKLNVSFGSQAEKL